MTSKMTQKRYTFKKYASTFRKIAVPFKMIFHIYLDCLSIEFSTYHIKCEDNVMILIQTLWRCARTLITTTTLSLLFHYSLSLLLYSTVQGRRKQGGRRGQTPPSDFVRYVNLISIRGQIMPTSHRINKYLPPPPCTIFSDLLTALQCTVVKLTSLVIIVAC